MADAQPSPTHPAVDLMRIARGGHARYMVTLRPPLTEALWSTDKPVSGDSVRQLLAACGLDQELVLNMMIAADNASDHSER